jgi:hypothetical protein
MADQAKWAERIAAMLRQAEDPGATPEERETFFNKAQELMAKYAIDEALLRASGKDKRADPISKNEFVTVGIYRHALFMVDYYVLINNGCQVLEIPGSPWRTIEGKVYKETRVLSAVGYESDIEKARVLATSLKLQCMMAESRWWEENKALYKNLTKGKQHQARRGFMLSFARGAYKKMQDASARGRASAEQEHGTNSVALVLRDKSLAVKDEFNKLYPHTKTTTSRMSQGDMFARGAGYEAGQRADIGQDAFTGSKKGLNR